MPSKPDLSIVIVTWNSEDWIKRCLTSVFAHTSEVSFEVIVVDNDSQDTTLQIALNHFEGIKIIENQDNKGFASAVNQGLGVASGRFLCLLNPDTELIDRTLEQLVAFLKKYPTVGIVGPHLVNEDKTTQPSVRRFPRLSDQLLIVLKLHHLFEDAKSLFRYFYKDFNYRQTQSVDQVMGACLMIRREVIEQIGTFDEHFFLWFEEVEYCHRLKTKTDFEVYYDPEAHLLHYGGDSFDKVRSGKKQRWYLKSIRYYFRRTGQPFAYLVILFFSPLSLFLGLIGGKAEKTKKGKEVIKKSKEKRKRK